MLSPDGKLPLDTCPRKQFMKEILIRSACVAALLIAFCIAASAQSRPTADRGERNVVTSVLTGTGKAAVVVVGSAAKATWAVTKFTAARVAAPAAKTLLLKAAPKAGVLMLRGTGIAAKHLLPVAAKLALL